ncbi:Atu4866 domain-containing protein [Nonomuraea insulae]|uniref:Atu4866 domain-containing protein n=1 Tax=Nonomuraea insulae TaxID=1616787 RepID=A0ABW1CWY2_9ACTN
MIGKALLVLGVLTTLTACADGGRGSGTGPAPARTTGGEPHPHVGMWVTADGRIRQELRSDGRYEEERDGRKRAYTGRYTVAGDHIDYFDDLGFTATGDVRDGVLYHEHLVLHRER